MLIKKALAKILPYVCIESGTSGGWTYKKYADGTAKAWITMTGTYATTTESGSSFISGTLNMNLPTGIFNTAPIMFGQVLTGGVRNVCRAYADSASTAKFILWDSSNHTVESQINFLAIGKWK